MPLIKELQKNIKNSTIVETNTYYGGPRATTEGHRSTLKINGWTFCPVDIMDENGAVMLPVKGGKHFKEMSMGKNIMNYDSMVVYTHFKGHTMGGFGGSIKNGKIGKKMQHEKNGSQWGRNGEEFMEAMVEAAKAATDHFGKKITFINVMKNMSVDCDCAGTSAAKPTAPDIGIVASTNIVAADQAAIDMVFALKNRSSDLQERIKSRHGLRQLSYGDEIGLGTTKYRLIDLDK